MAVSGYELVWSGTPSEQLRSLWGESADGHAHAVVTAPAGSSRGLVRFISTDLECPLDPPESRQGPFGMEFFSADVDEVHSLVAASGLLAPLGEPTDYDMSSIGSGTARSFAASGPAGIWFLFTTMTWVPPPRQLPRVAQRVGPVINMPVASYDPQPSLELYRDLLGMAVRFEGRLADPVVNRIVGLDPGRGFDVKVFSLGDGQMAEHHYHPAGALEPPLEHPGKLRPGPAVITFGGSDIAQIATLAHQGGWKVRGPVAVPEPPYEGASVLSLDGPDGETVEIVQEPATGP